MKFEIYKVESKDNDRVPFYNVRIFFDKELYFDVIASDMSQVKRIINYNRNVVYKLIDIVEFKDKSSSQENTTESQLIPKIKRLINFYSSMSKSDLLGLLPDIKEIINEFEKHRDEKESAG